MENLTAHEKVIIYEALKHEINKMKTDYDFIVSMQEDEEMDNYLIWKSYQISEFEKVLKKFE